MDKSQYPIMIHERREIHKRNSTNINFLVRWNILIGKESPKSLEILMRWRDSSEFRDTKEARVAGQSIRNKGMLRKSFRTSQEIPFESTFLKQFLGFFCTRKCRQCFHKSKCTVIWNTINEGNAWPSRKKKKKKKEILICTLIGGNSIGPRKQSPGSYKLNISLSLQSRNYSNFHQRKEICWT